MASGPIERSTNLIPQLTKEHKFNPKMIESGLSLMLVGYFKKMVVADNISGLISTVKDSPSEFSPLILFAFACLRTWRFFGP